MSQTLMPKPKPKPKPKKTASKSKPAPKAIAVRASAAYAAWVDELATHNRSTVAGLVDQALARFARETGFPTPPPER